MNPQTTALWRLLCLAAALLLPLPAAAHDIPADVRVAAFLRPEGQQLQLLVRVPMGAMNEVDLPLRGPGYLDLARADAALRVAAELWLVDNLMLYEDGRALPRPTLASVRVALAADRAFATWDEALALQRAAPIAPTTELYWKQQHLDVLLQWPIASERARFSIEPRLARMGLKVVTTLRLLPPGGAERAFEWHGNPGRVDLDPRWHQAALRFIADGFRHILDGTDHLLFIACLVIPFRRVRPVVLIVTAFTIAHSLTLAATAFGLTPDALWFAPLVETLIAASIVAMALENLFGTSARRRWIAAFTFGLVHGFGFAFALRESLQFAGAHLLTALLAFNVGVELGQLAVLAVLMPLLAALRRVLPQRLGTIVLSALLAHTAWHWLGERAGELARFPVPVPDAAGLAALLRWLMAAIVLALLLWAADRPLRRWLGEDDPAQRRALTAPGVLESRRRVG
jgi:hypothetical protein